MWSICRSTINMFDNVILWNFVKTQGWHMMTVAGEVARALRIANAPQELASSSSLSNGEKVIDRSISNADAPSKSPLSPNSSSDIVLIQPSPPSPTSFIHEMMEDKSSMKNVTTIGGCYCCLY